MAIPNGSEQQVVGDLLRVVEGKYLKHKAFKKTQGSPPCGCILERKSLGMRLSHNIFMQGKKKKMHGFQ